jgi:PD-(D/E)XK nuclease superfamily protein
LSYVTTDQKGAIAELAIAPAAVRLRVDVYRPVAEGGLYDLIFELEGKLWRVQCKWAPRHGEVVIVRCYSSRRGRGGLLRRIYDPGEIDAFAAYCPEVDRCYFLPYLLFRSRTQIALRLGPTQNNQTLGVNWASRFEFGATLGRQGAVAQLGERCDGIAEVTGSSPVGSIGT